MPEVKMPEVEIEEEVTTDETANWKTYRNEQYRFELKYPFDKYEILEKVDYTIIKPKKLIFDIEDPGHLLVIERRERKSGQTWEEFILTGAKLEPKLEEEGEEILIGREFIITDSPAGKDIYCFCRAQAFTVCHTFYVLEKDENGVPKNGIDVYFWSRYKALGNPYAKDYHAIIKSIKFTER
ncbi:MAG: hypothetical protein QME57_01610, partial [Patescibacteria group bacterium]|nr:hypothetical protein [Patescibacteria group bacterium]